MSLLKVKSHALACKADLSGPTGLQRYSTRFLPTSPESPTTPSKH
jgi:hypothetical protein